MLQGVFAQVSRMLKELFSCNRTIKWPKTMSEDAVPAAKRARTEEEGSSNEENAEGEERRCGQPEVTATEQVIYLWAALLVVPACMCVLQFATCNACAASVKLMCNLVT